MLGDGTMRAAQRFWKRDKRAGVQMGRPGLYVSKRGERVNDRCERTVSRVECTSSCRLLGRWRLVELQAVSWYSSGGERMA